MKVRFYFVASCSFSWHHGCWAKRNSAVLRDVACWRLRWAFRHLSPEQLIVLFFAQQACDLIYRLSRYSIFWLITSPHRTIEGLIRMLCEILCVYVPIWSNFPYLVIHQLYRHYRVIITPNPIILSFSPFIVPFLQFANWRRQTLLPTYTFAAH